MAGGVKTFFFFKLSRNFAEAAGPGWSRGGPLGTELGRLSLGSAGGGSARVTGYPRSWFLRTAATRPPRSGAQVAVWRHLVAGVPEPIPSSARPGLRGGNAAPASRTANARRTPGAWSRTKPKPRVAGRSGRRQPQGSWALDLSLKDLLR